MSLNIEKGDKKRVVIVGGGFSGLQVANKLKHSGMQVVLIDRNNYHQFPPLIYQVASAGMEPSSISFPFRRIFQHSKNVYFRMAELRAIYPEKKIIQTSIGKVDYDYLVLAAGTTTNFYGNKNVEAESMPMKTVSEAMGLQNAILANIERAITCATKLEQQELLNVVIVGGGATGVEVAGVLSEMKHTVLPHDYPDLDPSLMNIYLIEAGNRLLSGMSPESSAAVEKFLRHMGVNVLLNKMVTDYKDHKVILADGLPVGSPRKGRQAGYFRAPAYKRIDIGASRLLVGGEDKLLQKGIFRNLKSVWIGIDVFNLFDISNVNSYYWVTDITNAQYAVPNYLTRRQINLRLSVDF